MMHTHLISSSVVVVARYNQHRTALTFSRSSGSTDGTVDGIVLRKGEVDAVASGMPNGFIMQINGTNMWRVTGAAARQRWTAIRVNVDSYLTVMEEFLEDFIADADPAGDVPVVVT